MSCARIFPSLVKALGWKVNDPGSGSSTPALLASYDRDTQSWRTLERSLFEGSIPYSGALPRSGTMRNGRIYAPPMSERPTEGKEFGLWRTPTLGMLNADRAKDPEYGARKLAKGQTITLADQVRPMFSTPSATEYGTNQGGGMGRVGPVRPSLSTMARKGFWPTPRAVDSKGGAYQRDHGQKGSERPTLSGAAKLWPTPRTAGMCGGTGNWNQLKEKCENIEEARKMGAGNGGQLSPDWVEWLMNYPIGWTNLDAKSSRIAEPFSPEPDIPRVANSVKERVNRLKCLGNSIVPQIAELIFRQIKQF